VSIERLHVEMQHCSPRKAPNRPVLSVAFHATSQFGQAAVVSFKSVF